MCISCDCHVVSFLSCECHVSSSLLECDHVILFVSPGPPSQPAKPGVSKVTASSVKLKWPIPEHDGSSPILSYQIELLQDGFEEWQPIIQHPKNYFVVKTLESNTSYRFRVIAYNEFGASKPSETSDVMSTKGRGRSTSSTSGKGKGHGMHLPDGRGKWLQ